MDTKQSFLIMCFWFEIYIFHKIFVAYIACSFNTYNIFIWGEIQNINVR